MYQSDVPQLMNKWSYCNH